MSWWGHVEETGPVKKYLYRERNTCVFVQYTYHLFLAISGIIALEGN